MEIIFDIDGTLANCEHRRHFVAGPKKDWKAFFDAMEADTPILPVLYLLRELYHKDNTIILCSGRPAEYREETEEWLLRFKIPYDKLYMRKTGDYRPDVIVKQEMLNLIFLDGFSPQLAIDDRSDIAKVWKNNGLSCLLVA